MRHLGDVVVAHPEEPGVGSVVGHVRVADAVTDTGDGVGGGPAGGDLIIAVDR